MSRLRREQQQQQVILAGAAVMELCDELQSHSHSHSHTHTVTVTLTQSHSQPHSLAAHLLPVSVEQQLIPAGAAVMELCDESLGRS